MTTKSNHSVRKEKWNRPVSRKFYEAIIKQIHTVASLSDDINADNVIRCLDDYLTNRTATADFTETEPVVFTLLQPLIDQAMRRSERARQAAARRRQCCKPGETNQATSLSAEFIVTDMPRPSTREEKRIMRREATLLRRQQKHLKRLRNRQPKAKTEKPNPKLVKPDKPSGL